MSEGAPEVLVWKIHGASLRAVLKPVSGALTVIAGFVFEAGGKQMKIRPKKGPLRHVLVPEADGSWPERLALPDRFEWGNIVPESHEWPLKLRWLSIRWEGADFVGLRCVSEPIRDGKGWVLLIRPVLQAPRELLQETIIPITAVAFLGNEQSRIEAAPIPLDALERLIRQEIGETVSVPLYFASPFWRLDI